MKIFISQPMKGLSDEEILIVREQAIEEIKIKYQFFERNKELEIISTFEVGEDENIPEDPNRLWWLGRALQMLSYCDKIYMCKGWENSSGCRVEKLAAVEYNIGIDYQK